MSNRSYAAIIAVVVALVILLILATSRGADQPDSDPGGCDAAHPCTAPQTCVDRTCVTPVYCTGSWGADTKMEVSDPTDGACPTGTSTCPVTLCKGDIPRCWNGDEVSCPICVGGEWRCEDFHITWYQNWQSGPANPVNYSTTVAGDIIECEDQGDACKWAKIHSSGGMAYAGRGAKVPSATTGYRVVSSTGKTFLRDTGRDNSASFDPNLLHSSEVADLDACEKGALDLPPLAGGVPGAYAYVYDASTGGCGTYQLDVPSTAGTNRFVRGRPECLAAGDCAGAAPYCYNGACSPCEEPPCPP